MLYITLIYHIKQIVLIIDTISHKFLRNKDNNLDHNLVNVKTMKEIVSKARCMKEMLKLAFKFVKFVIIAAFSMATNERKFSHLKIVKNYLQSTMADERLDYLMLLSSEKDLTDNIHLSKTVSSRAKFKQRRIRVCRQ